jgi:hypothetical protein
MNDIQQCNSHSSSPIESLVEQVQSGRLGRRDFLRRAVKAGVSSAIAYSLLGKATANAQRPTTYAVGEETQALPQPPINRNPTTYAVGEESQVTGAYGEGPPPATTYAVGEEGQPVYTTQAVGEEQQPHCNRPQPTTRAIGEETTRPITTYAIGEEGNVSPPTTGPPPTTTPPITTWNTGEEGSTTRPTTQAIGEESSDGSRSTPIRRIESNLRSRIPKVWKGFGRW